MDLLTSLLIYFGIWIFGFMSGFFLRGRLHNHKDKYSVLIAIVITLVWLISTIAEIFVPGYTVSTYTHVFMGAIAGTFFKDGFKVFQK